MIMITNLNKFNFIKNLFNMEDSQMSNKTNRCLNCNVLTCDKCMSQDKYCSQCGQELEEVDITKRIIQAHCDFSIINEREPEFVYVGEKEHELIRHEFIELGITPCEVLVIDGLTILKVNKDSHFNIG